MTKPPPKTQQVGRLAMREEGQWWAAYYAEQGTMAGAIPLGNIRLSAVKISLKAKESFMELMRELVADIIEEKFGVRPTWGGAEKAPEHERAGTA
jgi:hypothetical protein